MTRLAGLTGLLAACTAANEVPAAWVDDAPSACVAAFAWDGDRDGRVDATGEDRYDLDGQLVASVRDWDDDGRIDRTETWTWEDGERIAYTRDDGGDGRDDHVETWSYSERGRLVEHLEDLDGDGIWDLTTLQDWSGGHLVTRTERAPGVPDRVTTFTYDERGLRVSESEDFGGDFGPTIRTHRYDDQRRNIRTELDRQGNGQLESYEDTVYDDVVGLTGLSTTVRDEQISTVRRVYDDQGRLVDRFDDDAPIDQIPDEEEHTRYDPATGGPIAWWGLDDLGLSEPVAYRTDWALDEAGRRVEAITTLTVPGQAPTTERSTWVFTCP